MRKIICLMVSIFIIISILTSAFAAKKVKFEDLNNYSWAKEYIEEFKEKGYISGTSETTFSPGNNVKREEFVKVVINVLGYPIQNTKLNFTDVKENDWFYPYISTAYKNGIVSGISTEEFGTGKYISREDMCVIIVRALEKKGDTLKVTNGKDIELKDESQISGYAKEAVRLLTAAGVLNGFEDGTFRPKEYANRAQMVKIMYLANENKEKISTNEGGNVDEPSSKPEEPSKEEEQNKPEEPSKEEEQNKPEEPSKEEEQNKPEEPSKEEEIVEDKGYKLYTDSKNNKLKIYDMPDEIKQQKSTLYKVELKLPNDSIWYEVDVYSVYTANAKTKGRENTTYNIYQAAIAYFDFDGKVEVRVTPSTTFTNARIRPEGSASTKKDNKAITFTIRDNGQYSLELYANSSWQTQTNLHIFANEIVEDVNPEDYDIYFGPGVHDYTTDKDIIKLNKDDYPYITLKSNTSMYIAGGAVVKAAIQINNGNNISIEGRGILDLADFLEKDSTGKIIMTNVNTVTPNAISGIKIRTGSNITIDGIIVKNAPRHSITGADITGCEINNVKIITGGIWTDGINMMSSSDVNITNCFVRTCDDCISIYASRGDSGFKTGKFIDISKGNTKDFEVENTILWADDAHAINIGTHGYYLAEFDKGEVIQNLNFEDISILQTRSLSKDDPVSAGGAITFRVRDHIRVSNITFKDISVEDIEDSHLISIFHNKGAQGQSPSTGINATQEDLNNPGYLINEIIFENVDYSSSVNKVETGLIEIYGIDKDNDGTKSVKNGDSIVSGVALNNFNLNGEKLECTDVMIKEYLKTNSTAMNITINGTSIIHPIKESQTTEI